MTLIGYRRLAILALLLDAVLLGLTWQLAMKCAINRADERGTWLAIRDFERSRELAVRSEPEAAVGILYQVAYLPPPRANAPLERIIERERERQVREIIEYLRKRTGEDLGSDPAKWIQKYSGRGE